MEKSPHDKASPETANPPNGLERTVQKLGGYLQLFWRVRIQLLKINAIVLVLAVIVLLFVIRRWYDSTITILPDYGNKSQLAGLSGLASTLASADLGQASPNEIFEDIIYSDAVLRPVIYAKYKTEEYKDSVDLIQYFDISPPSGIPSEKREEGLYRKFYRKFTKGHLETNVTGLTKILTITVTMPESQLSADVANNIAAHLDEYVRTQKKSYASYQVFYIEKRLDQLKDSLIRGEENLKNFQLQNRVLEQSPELLLEQNRLTRNVQILNEAYIQLSGQLELTKLDEIKDTPVVNVKEVATDPVIKTGPLRTLILFIVIVLSLFGSCAYIVYQDRLSIYWNVFIGSLRGTKSA